MELGALLPELLDRCAEAIRHCQVLIAAVPVDTIKVVDETGLIPQTDRRQLWAAQTPQAFDVKLLKQCHAEGRRQAGKSPTMRLFESVV